MCLLWPHHRGQCPKNTCCMKSQSHERLWPPLLKLKFGNGWLTNNCCSNNSKKFNSSFEFQFQFQGFQFQFHFQFHQFQFQFRNWNWNWAAVPIPELNWPQPWSLGLNELMRFYGIGLRAISQWARVLASPKFLPTDSDLCSSRIRRTDRNRRKNVIMYIIYI